MRLSPAYFARGMAKYTGRAVERYGFYAYWRRRERYLHTRSRETIRARQWRQLKAILAFAYDAIPFYRERFQQAGLTPDDVRTPADLQRVPLTTKDDIRQNFPDRLVRQGRRFKEWHLGQTSGSTADSMHFIRPENASKRGLYYSVFLRAGGITNVPIVMLTTPHCTAGTCSLREAQAFWIHRIHKIPFLKHLDQMIGLPSSGNILAAADAYWGDIAGILARLSPCIMVVDPVYLSAFARYLRRNRIQPPSVRAIVSTYELLTGSLKELLRTTFGCDVYTQYGGSELLDVANECEHHTLHAMPQNAWVEVIRNGQPAKPGEVGRAVLTDLGNYNMPFIRYDIGDLLEAGDGNCPCGRKTDTFVACHGRARDVIAAADGRAVTPLQADAIFNGAPGVAWYKLVQAASTLYRVSIMADGSTSNVNPDDLVLRGRRLLGESAQFQVRFVDEIKPERSMKFRFVYSELPTATI